MLRGLGCRGSQPWKSTIRPFGKVGLKKPKKRRKMPRQIIIECAFGSANVEKCACKNVGSPSDRRPNAPNSAGELPSRLTITPEEAPLASEKSAQQETLGCREHWVLLDCYPTTPPRAAEPDVGLGLTKRKTSKGHPGRPFVHLQIPSRRPRWGY